MIGTVIGFMFMLGSSFQQIDPSNIESMRQVIVDMASGMSTALLTTLCGLIAGLFIKVQIVMQEQEDV
jgi:biopolymer transport protein ExbB/TolQ